MEDKNNHNLGDVIMNYVEGLTELDLRRPKRKMLSEYSVDEYGEMIPATVIINVVEGENFGGDEIKCSICLGNYRRILCLIQRVG